MSKHTEGTPGRPPEIDPQTIHAAMREAHRLRAQTASALLSAAGNGIRRAWAVLREALAHAPEQRNARQVRTAK